MRKVEKNIDANNSRRATVDANFTENCLTEVIIQ